MRCGLLWGELGDATGEQLECAGQHPWRVAAGADQDLAVARDDS